MSRPYTSYKDGPDGGWSAPQLHIDGHAQPYGIPDYQPGFAGRLRFLSFADGTTQWVYLTWSLYSTGRIAYIFSSDGGQTWSGEDALAYLPIVAEPPPPTPFVPPSVWGTVFDPLPIWDAAHRLVFVVYLYSDRSRAATTFPVYAYGPPGAPGAGWTFAVSPTQEPARLFPPTQGSASGARDLRANEQTYAGSERVFLLWREQTGSRELFLAAISPATLLSGTTIP